MRVLFVDDESHVLDALRRQTRSSGIDASFALGGEQALKMVAQQPVDVVVTDMRMPGMDGAELLLRVRDLLPHAWRIVLSGEAGGERRQLATTLAHAWLTKPCTITKIRATIDGLREPA